MESLTLNKDSLFLRLFNWVWGSRTKNLNVCKLFWGTVFMPIGLALSQDEGERFALVIMWLGVTGLGPALFFITGDAAHLPAWFLGFWIFGVVKRFLDRFDSSQEKEATNPPSRPDSSDSLLSRLTGYASWAVARVGLGVGISIGVVVLLSAVVMAVMLVPPLLVIGAAVAALGVVGTAITQLYMLLRGEGRLPFGEVWSILVTYLQSVKHKTCPRVELQ